MCIRDRRPGPDPAGHARRDTRGAVMTVLSQSRTTTIPGPAPKLDVAHLEHLLLGRWRDIRRAARDLLTDERLHRVEDQSPNEHRERVLEQLRILVREGDVLRAFPTELGGVDDPGLSLIHISEPTRPY